MKLSFSSSLFSSLLFENMAVQGEAKSMLLFQELCLVLLCSSFYHYTMLLHLNQFKRWYDKSCSHADDPDLCQRKYLSVAEF